MSNISKLIEKMNLKIIRAVKLTGLQNISVAILINSDFKAASFLRNKTFRHNLTSKKFFQIFFLHYKKFSCKKKIPTEVEKIFFASKRRNFFNQPFDALIMSRTC